MAVATRESDPRWLTLLRQIATRNDSIELAIPGEYEKGASPTWRVRIFKMDETSNPKRILIDMPSSVLNRVSARPGTRFLGLMVDNDIRFGFDTRVIERTRVVLNPETRLLDR